MKQMKHWKRMLSIVLTAAMICSMAGMNTVSAAQADTTAASNGTLPDSVLVGATPNEADLTLLDPLTGGNTDERPASDDTVSGATLPAGTLMMKSQPGTPGYYNADDVAAVNAIIDDNGLDWTKADPADGSYIPSDWYVTWSTIGEEERITRLTVTGKGLTGSLDVSGLSQLAGLYCSDNNLTGLPDLPDSLGLLYCSRNNLTGLPDLPDSLKTLYCNNNLTELPALPDSLRTLDCHSSNLNGLPALPDSLTTLNCNNNNLTRLPDLPDRLTSLDCHSNNLTGLPTLPDLRGLDCYNNILNGLPALPDKLISLNCNNNNLNGLPALPDKLTSLNCNNNNLNGLPDLPDRLTSLDCSNNNLNGLSLNSKANYTDIDVRYNYMADTSAVTGQTLSWDSGSSFYFAPQHAADFVPVKDITDGPTVAMAGTGLALTAKVVPATATDQNIQWRLSDGGSTNASVTDGVFTAGTTGTASVEAVIPNGSASGVEYHKSYYITVIDRFSSATLSPGTATVEKSGSQQFSASLDETATESGYFDWSVDSAAGSTISADGVLKVSANETAKTLTVTAIFKGDAKKSATAAVTVPQPSYAVNVTNGTVSPADAVQGATVTITADTPPTGRQFKEWSINPSVTFVNGTGKNSPTAQFTMPAQEVSAAAVYEDLPSYAVNVTGGTASPADAVEGATVTITAGTPPDGRQFKEWSITPAATFVNGTDTTYATAQFTMPAQEVSATAVYEDQPSYAVNVTGGTASPSDAVEGTTVTITAGTPPDGRQFKEWIITPAATFVNGTGRTYSTAQFTMPAQTVSAAAVYEDLPAGTGSATGQTGGTGGSSGSSTPATSQPAINGKQPNMPTIGEAGITGTVTDQTLSATVSDQTIKDAVKAAQDAAKKAGKAKDGIAVVLTVSSSAGYESLSVTLSRDALNALKNAGVKFLTISSAVIDLTLNQKAIETVHSQTTGSVTVSATAQHKLSAASKRIIGSRLVFDITIRDSEGVTVSDLKGGTATIGIAYQPAGGEKSGNLCAVYVDPDGKPQLLPHSSYTGGRLVFGRNSLSIYGVGYQTPAPAFTDTVNHWAKDHMDFAASRGYLAGTSTSMFSPDAAVTRGDFITALGRLSRADVSAYKTGSFTDVPDTDPAMPYIEWAVENGIARGIDSNQFAPDGTITREQMAVMMTGYAKAVAYPLPVSRQSVTFADHAKISSWAKESVRALQQAGVISDRQDNLFAPQENATRAEASAVLHRFVELVIDEGTARGWVQNDAGQSQYINADGKMAVNITIDG